MGAATEGGAQPLGAVYILDMRTAGDGQELERDRAAHAAGDSADEEPVRDETSAERLDRNEIELLNELRVAGTGIQVLFAFLLIVPFNTGWRQVSTFDRDVYFVTLLCIAAATVLLIAPSVQHRVLFRRGEKPYLVWLGTRLTIVAAGFLGAGLTGILVLVSNVVLGGIAPLLVGAAAAIGVGGLWFLVPLRRLSHGRPMGAAEAPSPRRDS